MTSLQDLLSEEGSKILKNRKSTQRKDQITSKESISLSIFVCHDRKSIDFSKKNLENSFRRNGSLEFSSKRSDSKSQRVSSNSKGNDLSVDDVATREVISILRGYVARFLKDRCFRNLVHEKCSYFASKTSSENPVLRNLKLGIKNAEKLAENHGSLKKANTQYLRNSIQHLNLVSSLNYSNLKDDFTCGIPNSHISSYAHLYLSIVHKIDNNDRVSARYLLQIFCQSPSLARKHLLPDIWEHLFLPHLLHLKLWYGKELKEISDSDYFEKDRKLNILNRLYNDSMNMGTAQFALYYKEMLNEDSKEPILPQVSVPSRPSYELVTSKKSTSISPRALSSASLYRSSFPSSIDEKTIYWDSKYAGSDEKNGLQTNMGYSKSNNKGSTISSSQIYGKPKGKSISEDGKAEYIKMLSCRKEQRPGFIQYVSTNESNFREETNEKKSLIKLTRAVNTLCSSKRLSDCEMAIRLVAKFWLDSNGHSSVEAIISRSPVIEGLLEVLYSSQDDQVLEMSVSILAEMVTRNELNGQIILNSDPQLVIFIKLLRSKTLFLKSAVLLYLLKPKAKQMLSPDWIPLMLRILEIGDETQTLFTIRRSPQAAAFYVLDQLLTGFDVDRNLENAKQLISLKGLNLLIQRFDVGKDAHEKKHAASLLMSCIKANGTSRQFIANNIKKASIMELLVQNKRKYSSCALSLLTELICLYGRTEINKFLNGLKREGNVNAMHILLGYLHRAHFEQRPLIASILLLLDLMGDSTQDSIYREEVIDSIVSCLNCASMNERIQEKMTKALFLLVGHFSCEGEPLLEPWLLRKAGLNDIYDESFGYKPIISRESEQLNAEEKTMQHWLEKLASVLLINGNTKFLSALSKCMQNAVPSLSRACLLTVTWMSSSLSVIHNGDLQPVACSILASQLIKCLNYDRELEERVLASFSLMNFAMNSECLVFLSKWRRELMGSLGDLSHVTWTAKELLSITINGSVLNIEN